MKSPLFAFAVVVLAAMLVLGSGCATTEPYRGPAYTSPIVQVEERPYWNTVTDVRFPHWEMRRTLRFENPLDRPVAFEVDCTNNSMHVDVPARTVSRLLIVREDGACNIRRVR